MIPFALERSDGLEQSGLEEGKAEKWGDQSRGELRDHGHGHGSQEKREFPKKGGSSRVVHCQEGSTLRQEKRALCVAKMRCWGRAISLGG